MDAGERGGRLVLSATLGTLVLGAALRWPGLLAGFYTDDYQQLAMLRGEFVLTRAPWDLFWFGPDSPAERGALLDFGFLPWWTSPAHRLAMLRPLASLLIWVDGRLLGASALLAHLHSLAWWVALIAAVAALYRRLLPPGTAALAIALFALDEAHNAPLSWLANRSTLVSATFGALALLAHLRAREPSPSERGPQVRWLALSAALWALALAGGEYALGLLAYVLAFELLAARDSLASRAVHLAPAAALAGGYLAARAGLGYGAVSSGLYVSPADPVRFAPIAGGRIAALASELLLGVPSAWFQSNTPLRNTLLSLEIFSPAAWQKLPDWQSWQIALGAAALIATALLLRRLLRGSEVSEGGQGRKAGAGHQALRWLACGSLFGLLLAGSALPSSRLLAAPAIGASALIAAAVAHGLSRPRRGAAVTMLCAAALLVHGGLAARNAYADGERMRVQAAAARRWALAAELPADARAVDVVIVSASDFTTAAHLPWLRLHHGRALPRSYRRLSGALQPHELVRVDDRTLELTVLGGDVRDAFAGSLYRARTEPIAAGGRAHLPGMDVDVLAVRSGNPYRLRIRFERTLDDPRLVFLHARPDGLRRLTLPRVGQHMLVPLAALPR